MGTKDFNILDILIARMRLGRVLPYIRTGARVLDFGCGSQAMFLQTVQGTISSGVGLDYDADSRTIPPNIEVKNFRFEKKLPFEEGSFDTIVMLAVIEHIPLDLIDPLFAEFRRVLVKGGRIVFTTPTPAGKPVLEFLAFRLKIISAPEIADHKKYYGRSDMSALAKKHRFIMERYSLFQFGWNSLTVFAKETA
jgi:SAM-dependent methyltransferase